MKKYLLLLPLLSNIIAFGQQSKSDEQLDFLKKMFSIEFNLGLLILAYTFLLIKYIV